MAVGSSINFNNITYTLREAPSTVTTTRWGIVDKMVFEAEECKFYESVYEYGATEMQDHDELTEDDDFECSEVVPEEVTIVRYVKV